MGDSLIDQFKAERKAAPREEVLSAGPSAEYMRGRGIPRSNTTISNADVQILIARVQTLTKMLIQRFGDVLDVALTPAAPEGGKDDPPTLVETMNKKLTVDLATTAMIRAAEELMVLTRTMKELWLFGDLDTLATNQGPEEKEKRRQMQEDESAVVAGLQEWLRRNGAKLNKALPGQEDVAMSSD